MLPNSQQVHHVHQLTGSKGALHSVEQGLKIYDDNDEVKEYEPYDGRLG